MRQMVMFTALPAVHNNSRGDDQRPGTIFALAVRIL